MRKALATLYPATNIERDAWILSRRPERNLLDPLRPYSYFVEDECSASGEVVPIATVLLTNRECPWRCLMCDLWRNTLTRSVPVGAIPAQITYALHRLPPAREIKLYNSGSFFDVHAIPPEDYPAIARQVETFQRVIVECHPSLVGENCLRFRDRLSGRMEIAMGLETVHSETLALLNKKMTTEDFAVAAERLKSYDIDLRVFILVQPPFMTAEESLHWAERSIDFAFDCGATVATLIPTRGGNGAMDELADAGSFAPPRLATLEKAAEYGLAQRRGRVFVDLWDIDAKSACPDCQELRLTRLSRMNLKQIIPQPVSCSKCEAD
jgi:archaeosine synthase beta-subunit